MGHVTCSQPEFFSIKNKRKCVFPASVSRLVGLSHSWDSGLHARTRPVQRTLRWGRGAEVGPAQLCGLQRQEEQLGTPGPTQAPPPRPPQLGQASC